MKILNLYAGIGGNRKFWGNEHDITAVEINPEIAKIYRDFFPNDKIIVADAHQFLLEHYKEFDFIWSSPPCQSHSRTNYFLKANGIIRDPDLNLYEEIIFLDFYFKGRWVVENVISYYNPLIDPFRIGRHYFWCNFRLIKIKQPDDEIGKMCGKNQKGHNKPIEERNAVKPEIGLHILKCAFKIKQTTIGGTNFTKSSADDFPTESLIIAKSNNPNPVIIQEESKI